MSWIQDEWKEDLSADVRSHITEMETSLEKLQKDISQYQLKTDSLSSSNDNLNEKIKEKTKELKESERELSYVQAKLDEEIAKGESLIVQLKNKDDQIYSLNRKIENVNQTNEMNKEPSEVLDENIEELNKQLKNKDDLIESLNKQLDSQKSTHEIRFENLNSTFEENDEELKAELKKKEELICDLNSQLEILKKKIAKTEEGDTNERDCEDESIEKKESASDSNFYGEKIAELTHQIENYKQIEQELLLENENLEQQIDILNTEKAELEQKNLSKDSSTFRENEEELRAELNDKEELISALNNQLESLKEEIAKTELVDTNDRRDSGNMEKEELTSNLHEEKIAELTHQIENSKRIEQELRMENENLEHQIDILNTEKAGWEEKTLLKNEKSNVHCNEIGNYLGIDVKKSFSDSEVKMKNSEKQKLLEENKILRNELEMLRKEDVKKSCSDSEMRLKNSEKLLEENASLKIELEKLKQEQNTTELVMMRCDSEMLRAYQPTDDSKLLQTKDMKMDSGLSLTSQKSADQFKELLDQLETQKKEVKSLRSENDNLLKVYENHMKICKLPIERVSSRHENDTLENMRTKSELFGNLQNNVKSGFYSLEEKYSHMDKKLTDLSCRLNSSSFIDKLDCIADFLSDGDKFSKDWSSELEQLKTDLMGNFITVQDEVHKGHLGTREEINTAMDLIIESVTQNGRKAIDMNGERTRYVSSRRKGKTHSDEKNSNHVFHSGSQNGISELETIKERIEGVQHSISQAENEKRRIEIQRDKVQEELLKMVETLKRKEEEVGRLSQLFEEEKHKVQENESCYRSEMDELRREQMGVYEDFREMCETLKRKDIELANRNKQIKLITAEGREKEDELRNKLALLEADKVQVENEKEDLNKQYHEKCCEIDSILKRFVQADEQLRRIFNNLTKVDDVFLKAKSQGLYK